MFAHGDASFLRKIHITQKMSILLWMTGILTPRAAIVLSITETIFVLFAVSRQPVSVPNATPSIAAEIIR